MKNQNLLAQLKQNHPLVRVEHYRASKKMGAILPLNYFRVSGQVADINAKGGLTLVSVKTNQGKSYSVFSRVHPNDAYRNKLGVHLCAQKILNQIEVDNQQTN